MEWKEEQLPRVEKEKSLRGEECGRMFSVESKWKMFERRLLKFHPWFCIWKQIRGSERKRTTKVAKTRHVIMCIFLCVKLTNLKQDAFMARSAVFDMLTRRCSPTKKLKKVQEYLQLGCVFTDVYPRKSFLRKEGNLEPNHAVKVSRSTWHHFEDAGKEGSIASDHSEAWTSRGHERSLCNKKDASPKPRGTWRKNIYKLKKCGQSHVLLSYWSQGNAGAQNKISRGTRFRDWFRSFNAHAEEKRKIQAQKNLGLRGDPALLPWCLRQTVKCKQTRKHRNCADIRRYAYCSIIWKTLWRTRTWVGQQSKITVDQKYKKIM